MLKLLKEQLEWLFLGNEQKASYLAPTWQDCDVINSVLSVLSRLSSFVLASLEDLTDLLSGEIRVTALL